MFTTVNGVLQHLHEVEVSKVLPFLIIGEVTAKENRTNSIFPLSERLLFYLSYNDINFLFVFFKWLFRFELALFHKLLHFVLYTYSPYFLMMGTQCEHKILEKLTT